MLAAIPALFCLAVVAPAPDAAVAPTHVGAAPLDASWSYSRDGGAFTATPPAGAAPNNREGIVPLVFRGTFQVTDPAAVAGLWIRIAEPGEAPKASICNGGLKEASGGYWKDLGACPTLLDARVTLNGKPVGLPHGPVLTTWLPVEGGLVAGENTIELAGNCYTYWMSPAAEAIHARLAVAGPQPPTIFNGPIVGDFGPDWFTVACRTSLPADLTIKASPVGRPAEVVTAESTHRIWHRLRVALPADTPAATYTLTARVGSHESSLGPFTVRLLARPADGFRFVMFGNVMAHTYAVQKWAATARFIESLEPAFVLNAGTINEHGTWEHKWQARYVDPAASMLSSIPSLISPCSRDTAGVVDELHVTPAADAYGHTWSKVVGPVRFIGIDGRDRWEPGGANTRWLDETLAAAPEKFVFVLSGYPAWSSGKNSKKLHHWMAQNRDVIMPLLARHRVAAMLSGNDPDYERCEPPRDVGCTQLVVGSAGKDAYGYSGSAINLNPYAQGKAAEWAGAPGTPVLCVFDVRPDRVEMRALTIPGDPAAEPQVVDTKTFPPR